jgi:hypothetical protein
MVPWRAGGCVVLHSLQGLPSSRAPGSSAPPVLGPSLLGLRGLSHSLPRLAKKTGVVSMVGPRSRSI